MPRQRRRERRHREAGDAERAEQVGDLRRRERLKHLQGGGAGAQELVAEGLRFDTEFGRPEGEDPAQADLGRGQMLQHLDARGIGELQVVDPEAGKALGARPAKQRLDGMEEAHAVGAVAEAPRPAELGQQRRELGRHGFVDGLARLAEQPSQQSREQRVRNAGVTRTRGDRDAAAA